MSGGCCSPLGPGPAPALPFYQTVLDSTGTAKPQEAALKFSADFTATDVPGVATLIAAPGIAAAAAAAATAQATANTAESDAATAQATANAAGAAATAAQTTANTAVTNAAAAQTTATAAQQPFKGTYYVDPAFGGTQLGSASNPFTTIAAAFTAMVALSLVGGVVRIPPSVTVTENVVFPDTGGNWEIASDTGFDSSTIGPRITGTLTATSTSAAVTSFRLSNVIWNGNISGNTSSGVAEMVLRSVRHIGTMTLTTSGSGAWVIPYKGDGAVSSNKVGGSSTALVSVAGILTADAWVFVGGFTDGPVPSFNPPQGSQFHDCQFGDLTGTAVPIALNGTASNSTRFFSCFFDGPVTFTILNANHTILMDPASYASLLAVGVTFAGAGASTAKIQVLGASAPDLRTLTGNLGSTNLGARAAPGLYQVLFDQTMLVSGTSGTAQLNIIYTDMTGTLVTVPLGTGLLVTAAAGTKVSAVLAFQHNGAVAPIAYSVTGVGTAGSLSIASAVSIVKLS